MKTVLYNAACGTFGWTGEHFEGGSRNSEDGFSVLLDTVDIKQPKHVFIKNVTINCFIMV